MSVIPVRDGAQGLELFVQHRQQTMDFAPGAVVFPGGRCDPLDGTAGAGLSLPEQVVDEHVRRWAAIDLDGADPRVRARTLLATGLRELFEETGLRAEASALVPWDRWVTPAWSPKRFDVAFFVLPVEADAPGQPRHQTTEATRSGWDGAAALLRDEREGRLTLLTPTRVIIEELVALGDVGAVMDLRPVISGVRDDRPESRPRSSVGWPATGQRWDGVGRVARER